MPENPHAGHRSRMKERFLKQGLADFAPHEVLELLLYYASPRKDVNALAHRLLQRFGTLRGVFAASREELLSVEGVGEHMATLLLLMQPLYEQLRLEERPPRIELRTPVQIADHIRPLVQDKREEGFYLLCLDASQRLLRQILVSEGTATETKVHPRQLVRLVLQSGCGAVVFAHNHPGGIANPSGEDIQFTRRMVSVLEGMGIPVLDHIIVADSGYFSFSGQGLLEDIRLSLEAGF